MRPPLGPPEPAGDRPAMAHLGERWPAGVPAVVALALMASAPEPRASEGDSGGGTQRVPLGAVTGGWSRYRYPYYVTVGPDGPVTILPPWARPVIVIDRGPVAPAPVPVPVRVPVPARTPAPETRSKPKRQDGSKATQLVTIGDRLFRAGNLKRATERYEQALRANPDSASPRVRLSQVALHRGQYDEAARQLREAVAAEPDWLSRAGNIEALYGEPADFRRQIARLESRVHAEPADRDAWLVLGAMLYLSGQTRRAGDVFVRLSDRRPDPALAAFLDATAPATVSK